MNFHNVINLIAMVFGGIILPLLAGYAFRLNPQRWAKGTAQLLTIVVMVLILLMGVIFGMEPDIQNMLANIGWNGALFFSILSLANLSALYCFCLLYTSPSPRD